MLKQINTTKPREYDELMTFLEKSYNHPKGLFQSHYPHVWRRETIQFNNRYIIKDKEKIISHMGIYPMNLIADKDTIKVGGIGGVATDSEYRSRGFMGHLMERVIKDMKNNKFPISILWGDRQRYGYFGYELAGQEIRFSITKRSLGELPDYTRVNIIKLSSNTHTEFIKKIIELHEKEPLIVKRSKEEYLLLLTKSNINVWLGNEKDNWAYIIISENEIIESAGEPKIILSILSYMFNNFANKITVYLPFYSIKLMNTFYKVAENWSINPFLNLKILNLKKTLIAFSHQIEQKWKLLGDNKRLDVTFEMRDTSQKVTLHLGKEIEISEKSANEKFVLSEKDMVSFLFGSWNKNIKGLPIFPLNFYIWRLDYI